MSTLFVTGTGTGVGKTFITCALVRQLKAAGRPVRALKPVLSGLDDDVASSDAGLLMESLGRTPSQVALDEISPFRFRAPLSPDMAARREGRTLSVDELVRFCRGVEEDCAREGATLLIEGVGGAFVPLNERETVADWICALGAPALVVAGSYLGTLSHTLTTLAALRARGVQVKAVVVSESRESPVPLEETLETLRRFSSAPVVGVARGSVWVPVV